MFNHALAGILDHLKREPSRTGSIIITIYGDAIVPRGGSLWLGTLLIFFEALEIGSGVVRTAMSRLAADGWLERRKVGRNSFYRLTDKGSETFANAARHIYSPHAPDWTGQVRLILLGNGADREAARNALEAGGFGSPTPGVWIAPEGCSIPNEARGAIALTASAEGDAGRRLAAESWPLDRTAAAYRRFLQVFEPLRSLIKRRPDLSDPEAFTARILLIHEYRRVILRDPILPAALLPDDWPGTAARQLCSELYRPLLPASERWLDHHGSNETGPLPSAGALLAERFRS